MRVSARPEKIMSDTGVTVGGERVSVDSSPVLHSHAQPTGYYGAGNFQGVMTGSWKVHIVDEVVGAWLPTATPQLHIYSRPR